MGSKCGSHGLATPSPPPSLSPPPRPKFRVFSSCPRAGSSAPRPTPLPLRRLRTFSAAVVRSPHTEPGTPLRGILPRSLGEVQIPQRVLPEPSQSHLSPASLSSLLLATHTPLLPLVSATTSPVSVSPVVQEPACTALPLGSLCRGPRQSWLHPGYCHAPHTHVPVTALGFLYYPHLLPVPSPPLGDKFCQAAVASYSSRCASPHHNADRRIVIRCVCLMGIEQVHQVSFFLAIEGRQYERRLFCSVFQYTNVLGSHGGLSIPSLKPVWQYLVLLLSVISEP